MAPEVIKGHNYNEKVDVWSIGVITYMLISGRNPFPGATKEDVKLLITRPEPVDLDTPKLAMMSLQAKDFIMKSMEKEPRRRASAKQLLDHPWIKEMISQRPSKEVKKDDQIQIL
jgi:serine/threonine protein kinase